MSLILGALGTVSAAVAAAIANGFLQPLEIHYRAQQSDAEPTPPDPDDTEKPFVGLALSGGGARAAAFAAAGMKALHDRGLLSDVTHVSSVSGGGFAAAYLATHPVPDQAQPYFDRMFKVIAYDYFWDTQIGQVTKLPRLFSPSRRLSSLKEALQRSDFLGSSTFADLPNDRTFYFNSVSYDTGQRFTFSNGTLPQPGDTDAPGLPPAVRTLSFSTKNARRATPSDVPIALAVATSAAFPPYLGPMTIQMDRADGTAEFWHLGDGGVVENTGVETLREAIYARADQRPARIYAFDAGKQLDADLSKNTADISIWSKDVTRLVDVVVEYGGRQRKTLADALDSKHDQSIELITFSYMDVVRLAQAGDLPGDRWHSWRHWSKDHAKDRLASKTPAEHLAKIPTALKITPCNLELITAAAEDLVNLRFPLPKD